MPDDSYPTFDRCPHCSGLLWSDSDATWCEGCDWSVEQGRLDFDSPSTQTE